MGREYIPIYLDWTETTQDLLDEEKGRLIDACILYITGGDYESKLIGSEKIAFRFMKGQIDRNAAISEVRSKAGSNKRDQTTPNDIKNEQTISNDIKIEQNESKASKKEKRLAKADTAMRFIRFWAVYPRKQAKQLAVKAFEKLNPDDQLVETMIQAVVRQSKTEQWKKDGGQFIPMPSTWINQRRWEDEVTAATSEKTVTAQDYSQRDYADKEMLFMRRLESQVKGE